MFGEEIEPWDSNEIGPGLPWHDVLREELKKSKLGIVCVTPENLSSPWLMFEAGVLAHQHPTSRVVPYCLGVDIANLPDPIRHFQAVKADQAGTYDLVKLINQVKTTVVDQDVLKDRFLKFWQEFEQSMAGVLKHDAGASAWESIFHVESQEPASKQIQSSTFILSDRKFETAGCGSFEAYNRRFYEMLISSINSAKRKIILAGHGFDYYGGRRVSRLYANQYLRSIANAAEKLPVIRIEYTDAEIESQRGWIDDMSHFLPFHTPTKQSHPDFAMAHVGITVLKPNWIRAEFFKNFALIDWDDPNHAKCIIMLPTTVEEDGALRSRADVALYCEDKDFCDRLAHIVLTVTGYSKIANNRISFESRDFQGLYSSEEVITAFFRDELAKAKIANISTKKLRKVLYFAYGSNMNPRRLFSRTVDAKFKFFGILPNSRISFRKPKNIPLSSAVASFEDSENDFLYGVVCEMSEYDKETLDFFEAVDDMAYESITVRVRDSDNKYQEVKTFRLREGFPEESPKDEYLQMIIEGLKFFSAQDQHTIKQSVRDYIERYLTF
jgi:hypothetical protein